MTVDLLRLDLGSGPTVIDPGFTGADLCGDTAWDDAKPGQVARVDLREFPWPWADDSVSEVWCSHYICHQTGADWINMVDELFRILVNGGTAQFLYPNIATSRAFQDPTYLDHIPLERWSYADRAWRRMVDCDRPPYPSCDFELAGFTWTGMHDDFHARSDEVKRFATAHYWNAAADCSVRIRARKTGTPTTVNPSGRIELGIQV